VGPKLGSRMMGCIGKWIGYYIFLMNFEKVQFCLKMLHKCIWGQLLCRESNMKRVCFVCKQKGTHVYS
jgi:hypothetical protein